MKQVYITLVRSLLEQSSTVWHSSLSQQNKIDLERVQKLALKIILKDQFISYEHALNILELETLKNLCIIVNIIISPSKIEEKGSC